MGCNSNQERSAWLGVFPFCLLSFVPLANTCNLQLLRKPFERFSSFMEYMCYFSFWFWIPATLQTASKRRFD